MHMLQNKREIDDSFSALVKAVMFVFSEMFNLNSFESLHGDSQGFQITCLCQFMKIPYQKRRVVVVVVFIYVIYLSVCSSCLEYVIYKQL